MAAGLAADSSGGCFVSGGEVIMHKGEGRPRFTFTHHLIRFDGEGKELWAHAIEPTKGMGMNSIRTLATDRKASVCLAATVVGTVDVDPGPKTAEFASPGDGGGRDTGVVVVCRYTLNGELINAFRVGTAPRVMVMRTVVDEIGDIYLGGLCVGKPGLGPDNEATAKAETGIPRPGLFTAKYSTIGKLAWARVDLVEEGSGGDSTIWGLAVTKKLGVLAAGKVYNDLVLQDGRRLEAHSFECRGIVLRLDSQGRLK